MELRLGGLTVNFHGFTGLWFYCVVVSWSHGLLVLWFTTTDLLAWCSRKDPEVVTAMLLLYFSYRVLRVIALGISVVVAWVLDIRRVYVETQWDRVIIFEFLNMTFAGSR